MITSLEINCTTKRCSNEISKSSFFPFYKGHIKHYEELLNVSV